MNVDSVNSISQLWIMLGSQDSAQYRTSDIYKQIILILSRLSDSAPGKRGSYFQAQALYLSLRTS